MQEASLQRWAGWGSTDNETNIPERICLNKEGGEVTCHVCSLAGGKGWVPGAHHPLCIPRQPRETSEVRLGAVSLEICTCSFNKHLAKWSPSPEPEHPIFMKIMHPVCSGSREDGKELLRYLFC